MRKANLFFILSKDTPSIQQNAIWSTHTAGTGKGPFNLTLGEDGKLYIIDSTQTITW